ncbi:MAG: exosortase A [Geminicoccaceae bacterium]
MSALANKAAPRLTIAGDWRIPLMTLTLILAFLLVMTADTVSSMIAVWYGATTYHHCFLVLPISLFLIWRKRAPLARLTPRQEPLALLLLFLFAVVWLVGRAGQIQLLQHVALIGMAISITVALLGRDVARLLAFPLAFLGFMIPIGEFLVPSLQQFTANVSVLLLRLAQIPVFHDGIMIETSSGLFQVAEACAGIRFLIANVMIATLFAYLALERVWKWALFLTLAVIIPIVANSLRAFGIILIAYLTDNDYAAGVDHVVYGWGFFAAIMLLFLAIGSWIADWPVPLYENGRPHEPGDRPYWRTAFVLPALVIITLAGPIYAVATFDRPIETVAVDPKVALSPDLAKSLAPACRTKGTAHKQWRPAFKHADFSMGIQLECADRPVDLFVAYYAYERKGAELIHHANRLADGKAWTRRDASWYAPDIEGLPRTLKKEELFGRDAGDRLVLAWYWIGGRQVAREWQAKSYQLYRKLLGKNEPVALIALSTAYDDTSEEALPSLAEVLRQHKDISDYLEDLASSER